jgi:antirestriction protein ArdC
MKENKVNDIITAQIVEQLEQGNLTWLKNWSLGFGVNYKTGREYQGINALLLNISLTRNNYSVNQWLTFKQIQEFKGKLNKGSKATPIIYYKINEVCSCKDRKCNKYKTEKNDEHKLRRIPILRYYNVFNLSDTNLELREKVDVQPVKEVEEQLSRYWDLNTLRVGNPAYSPSQDVIFMPPIGNFTSKEAYYSALTHELIHSTGHKDRLAREGVTGLTVAYDSKYAYEELIAELGSAFLCAKLKIEKDIKNCSAYIKSWLTALRDDKQLIFKASRESEKAKKFILEGTE